MRDMDRFAEFLLREATGYNAPPDTPADAMWPGVEARLGAAEAGTEGGARGGLDGAADPLAEAWTYNVSPPAPREEMWARIEAAWALGRSAVGRGTGPAARAGTRWSAWPGRKGWVAALAAAASLVLGIALGSGTRPGRPAPTPPTAPSATAGVTAPAEPSAGMAEREGPARDDPAGVVTTVPAARHAVAADPQPESRAPPPGAVAPEYGEAVALRGPGREGPGTGGRHGVRSRTFGEPEHDHVTARHLGRAATLLTAFRTDRRTPASQQDLARWARELLAETRMFLGLSSLSADSGPVEEVALLEDLELVLIQIAGLGPGAPDFEWDLARESMERRGTLMRLRAASAADET